VRAVLIGVWKCVFYCSLLYTELRFCTVMGGLDDKTGLPHGFVQLKLKVVEQ
jgi:hypothetical protein